MSECHVQGERCRKIYDLFQKQMKSSGSSGKDRGKWVGINIPWHILGTLIPWASFEFNQIKSLTFSRGFKGCHDISSSQYWNNNLTVGLKKTHKNRGVPLFNQFGACICLVFWGIFSGLKVVPDFAVTKWTIGFYWFSIPPNALPPRKPWLCFVVGNVWSVLQWVLTWPMAKL